MPKSSTVGTLNPVSEKALKKLKIHRAGEVDLRRDICRFVQYVTEKGLLRTRCKNDIPKGAARRLAKDLSWKDETDVVEDKGCGHWSDHVSMLALGLGLVSFDTEGTYVGYTSREPSFIDNWVEVNGKQWDGWLKKKTPLDKEKAILDQYVKNAPNEFFHQATLMFQSAFDGFGCGTGVASHMDLPGIRTELLNRLLRLEPETWYSVSDWIDVLEHECPELILDPAKRQMDWNSRRRLEEWKWHKRTRRKGQKKRAEPKITLEDIYENFRECRSGKAGRGPDRIYQITSKTPDAFRRVEGRYIEFFLQEIPYLCGFIDLAFRGPSDHHGLDVSPSIDRLKAFRLRPKFFHVMRCEKSLDRVDLTVLPNLEILVEAESYPDVVLHQLEPFVKLLREEGPVHRFRIEKKKVVEFAAQNPTARSARTVLNSLSQVPLPENVAVQVDAWSRHGEKFVIHEGCGLVEFADTLKIRGAVCDTLGQIVVDSDLEHFALVADEAAAVSRLEQQHHVPLRVLHRKNGFVNSPGRLSRPKKSKSPARKGKSPAPREKVTLETEDFVGIRSTSKSVLDALHTELVGEGKTCFRTGERLILSASTLPAFRKALRSLVDRFEVVERKQADPVRSHST